VDRTGFQVFSKEVLDNVELGEKAKSVKFISFGGYENDSPSRQ
jgi:hypothetical protein